MANSSVLGSPTGPEGHWASAGGGWAQPFQRGWALVSDDGRGGMVTGPLLPYFTSHGFVNASGWPTGNAVTDSKGTYQRFGSKDGSNGGTLMSSSSGTYRLKGGMEQMYFDQGLRSALGSLTGEEARWATSGGGWAQHFTGGWLMYKSSAVKGYVPASFPWPDLGKLGWPKGGPQSACGGTKIVFERGYAMQDNRWCPSSGFVQPATSIAWPSSPALGYRGFDSFGRMGDGGLKVWMLMPRLGYKNLGSAQGGSFAYISSRMVGQIKAFQSTKNVPRTGQLDAATWRVMNTGLPWNIDSRPASIAAPRNATRDQHISAMVSYAKSLANKPYIYGAGDAQYGADCSGLALQSLHAAGLDLPVTIMSDIRYPMFLAEAMWNVQGIERHDQNSHHGLQAGDLVFFTNGKKNANGTAHVSHVAVMVDATHAIDAESTSVQTRVRSIEDVDTNSGVMVGYLRPFTSQ